MYNYIVHVNYMYNYIVHVIVPWDLGLPNPRYKGKLYLYTLGLFPRYKVPWE